MALVRLHNETWGFDSNCFVCEPKNQLGLRIPFHHDEERDIVVAEFTLDNTFSGAPTLRARRGESRHPRRGAVMGDHRRGEEVRRDR